mmetsp:Transcript_12526/g.41084  ORF Transcript_12526/g.41084 Transcript_12526/m.41084 type:complete len:238 (+) Transcript_12526:786-1499(+)
MVASELRWATGVTSRAEPVFESHSDPYREPYREPAGEPAHEPAQEPPIGSASEISTRMCCSAAACICVRNSSADCTAETAGRPPAPADQSTVVPLHPVPTPPAETCALATLRALPSESGADTGGCSYTEACGGVPMRTPAPGAPVGGPPNNCQKLASSPPAHNTRIFSLGGSRWKRRRRASASDSAAAGAAAVPPCTQQTAPGPRWKTSILSPLGGRSPPPCPPLACPNAVPSAGTL